MRPTRIGQRDRRTKFYGAEADRAREVRRHKGDTGTDLENPSLDRSGSRD